MIPLRDHNPTHIKPVVTIAFIVALLIRLSLTPDTTTFEGIKLLCAGAVVGIGSIGPSIGQLFFARSACTSIGVHKKAYNRIFAFSLLSQAIIENVQRNMKKIFGVRVKLTPGSKILRTKH